MMPDNIEKILATWQAEQDAEDAEIAAAQEKANKKIADENKKDQ